MRLSVFQKGLVLVGVPLVFELVAVAASMSLQREYDAARWWTDHTGQVIDEAQDLLATLLDARAAARGYVITADDALLGPYEDARRTLPAAFERLHALVADNPSQATAADGIERASREFMDWQAAIVNSVRAGRAQDAADHVRGSRRLSDALRKELEAFIAEERRLSEIRTGDLVRVRSLFNVLSAAEVAGGVAVSLALAFAFSRSLSRRQSLVAANIRDFGAGRPLGPPVSGTDEIAELDGSFRAMAADLARAQSALREQREVLQSILDGMSDGVVVADADGKFLIFNPAGVRLFGQGATDVGPSAWSKEYGVFCTDRQTPFPTEDLPLVRAMRGESSDNVEMFVRHAACPEGRWVEVSARPLLNESGGVRGGVVVCRDVTGRREAADLVRRAKDELERRVVERTAELLEANRDLARKNEENAMFVYSVSHDLRSPLVNLLGFSKELTLACKDLRATIADARVPEEVRRAAGAKIDGDVADSVHYIESSVRRLSGIIDALLRLSRAGRVQYQMQRVDVDALTRRVVAALHATIAERSAEVVVRPLPAAWGDPAALDHVFANLIGNAVHYLDPARPGRVEIGVLEQEPGAPTHVCYYVKDNGRGIPSGSAEKVFQAFQRLHPSAAPGEGMGLAIVRRTVDRHGGRIWFESEVGRGSTFFVELPAGPAPPTPEHATRKPDSQRKLAHAC